MNYKRIIKSQRFRFFILKTLRFLPDKLMLALQYYIKMGRKCNFKNPQTWTEKLQCYKMYYRNPLLGICVDKYEVRNFIIKKGLSEHLIELYGVYNRAEDIDFSRLPKSFVIKSTDGGGGNNVMLVQDKSNLNINSLRKTINSWLNIKDINAGREWAYTQIKKSQIIIEKFLINKGNCKAGIEDFKILCFSGNPQYIIIDKDRFIDHKRNFYDTNWNRIDVTTDHVQFEEEYPKPNNLSQMLEIAKILSHDFPFVRVDLYNIEGKIFVGELTFYPWSGYVKFVPQDFDKHLGDLFDMTDFINK